MVGYRLISGDSFFISRSFCPHCRHTLAWYDLVPIISFFLLRGSCRFCHQKISHIYPLIEFLTVLSLSLLISTQIPSYYLGYSIFFSALLISIRTDLEHMLISRFVSLYAIPIGFLLSYINLLPIHLTVSFFGAISAYITLWGVKKLFFILMHKEGLGDGDIELLAFIGAFIGPIGWWYTLFIGSLVGTLASCIILFNNKEIRTIKIPFGPFLALGAMIYTMFGEKLLNIIAY